MQSARSIGLERCQCQAADGTNITISTTTTTAAPSLAPPTVLKTSSPTDTESTDGGGTDGALSALSLLALFPVAAAAALAWYRRRTRATRIASRRNKQRCRCSLLIQFKSNSEYRDIPTTVPIELSSSTRSHRTAPHRAVCSRYTYAAKIDPFLRGISFVRTTALRSGDVLLRTRQLRTMQSGRRISPAIRQIAVLYL